MDYKNGKIYKMICNNTGLCYIGSTTQKLCKRKAVHKSSYKRFMNGKGRYITSYKVMENNDYEIVLVQEYPCDNKEQLHRMERFYIENTACVNKCIPTRTVKEYHEQNKTKISQQKKEYYIANRQKLLKKYNTKFQCPCGGRYTHVHKAVHCRTLKHLKYLLQPDDNY